MEGTNFKQYKVFGLVKNQEGKIQIVLGKYVVKQETFDSFEDAKKYIDKNMYEMVIAICEIVYYDKEQHKNNNENEKQN